MSDFLIFKAAFNNSATPAIGTYTAEGATALFNINTDISPDYYLYNTADDTAVQWFVPTAETTDFEFVADILTRNWTDSVTYFIIADSTGTTRLRMWSVNDNWHFENSDSIATTGDPEYIGVIDPTTSGGFGVFHQFRVRVRKLTASSSSVEVYVDGALKLTATAGAALVTCAKIGFVGGVSTFGPGTDAGVKNAYVYDLSGGELVDRGVLSGAFNRFISWIKTSVLPIGSYIQFAGSQAPDGFLVCNGGAISRTTYSALFAVIGTTYGSGDGSTTFNLPNLTDRFLQGSTTSGTVKNAGLPNITGTFFVRPASNNSTVFFGGALARDTFISDLANGLAQGIQFGDLGHYDVKLDASQSNSIYGNSSTVQPPALTCLICIKY